MFIFVRGTPLQNYECHLPYGIEILQCYVPPDTNEPQPDRPLLDLSTLEGWKAELTYVYGYIEMVYLSIDSHLSK